MTKSIRLIQSYLLYAFPFVLAAMLWGAFHTLREADAPLVAKALWEVLGWNVMIWFAVLIIFLFMLVAVPEARESTLARLARLKERDEREQQITGRASRTAFVSTLSVMILFLFFSMFVLNVKRNPENSADSGKHLLSITMQFKLFDEPRVERNDSGQVLFETKDIPFSKSAIILVFMVWQLGVFQWAARREQRLE